MAARIPWFLWSIVLGVDVLLVAFASLAVRRHVGRGAVAVGSLLSAWLVLAVLLSAAGAFGGGAGPVPRIAFGVAPPILAAAIALAASPSLRARALAIPLSWLVGIQALRVVGAVFLVLLAQGVLPAQFALPAGLGDVAVGAAAPLVAWSLARGKRWAPRLAVAWSALGLLDLAVALGMGALSAAEGPMRVFTSGPSADPLTALPLSLIPVFGVPIFVILHLVSLLGLRDRARRRRAERTGFGPAQAFAR